jgi:hypothetical protein
LAPFRVAQRQPFLTGDVETTDRLQATNHDGVALNEASSSKVSLSASPWLHIATWCAIGLALYQGVDSLLVFILVLVLVACWFYDVEVTVVRSLRPTALRMRPDRIDIQAHVQDNELVMEDTDLLVDV